MRSFVQGKRLSRRGFLGGAAALGVSGLLARGGRGLSSVPTRSTSWSYSKPGKLGGSLQVWGVVSFTPEGDHLLGQQMMDWGKQNGVSVTYTAVPGTDYETKVGAAIQAGALPDVVMLESTDPIYYAGQGHLADITDVYDQVKQRAGGMFESALPYCTVKKKMYAIPMQVAPTVLYSRLDLCQQVTGKAQAPTTLDELEKIAKKVNNPPNLYGIGLTMGKTADSGDIMSIMFADGATLVDKHGKPAINNAGTVRALTRIKRWWDEGLIPKSTLSSDDSWNNNQYESSAAAFVWNAASIYGYLQQNNPTLLKNTSQGPLPSGAGGSVQSAGPWEWAVSATSKNKGAARELIADIMKPDNLESVYEKVAGRWYPVYKDLAQRPYWKDNAAFAEFPELISKARPDWYPAAATPQLLAQIAAFETSYQIAQVAQQVVVSGLAPKQAASMLQQQMTQSFAQTASS